MRKWIYRPHVEGTASRQAHADLPHGAVERELGSEGFFGPATQMVHPRPPTDWVHCEGPLRPRAFDLAELDGSSGSPWNAVPVLHNPQLALRLWRLDGAMDHLVRNADGDELIFVHRGTGELFCDYGHLTVDEGDYVVLPRGTMWRLEASRPFTALLLECTNGRYMLPDKGLVGEHAIFDPAMLDLPRIDDAFHDQRSGAAAAREWPVRIKRRGTVSTLTYDYNPLDALGWHGSLYPVRLNVRDIRPLMSHRYHVPPSAHTTFVGNRFVVCTFAPRPFESDPGALKIPFFHNNDDYDEVLFYHAGDFFSRDNIRPGMMTLHPAGLTHGPHPKALANMLEQPKAGTDEYAVMIDARDALETSDAVSRVEQSDYHRSWQRGGHSGKNDGKS
jgi:homogentisate 1,2-dioxygenase